MQPLMTSAYTTLSVNRARQLAADPPYTATMRELEKLYGRYLYLPFAVEPILPDNMARFKEWYLDVSIPVRKIAADIACGVIPIANFRSIENFIQASGTPIWEQNYAAVFAEFPELGEKVAQLPYVGAPRIKIWSSLSTIMPHRDQMAFWDLPMGFRTLLFDENPKPTLYVSEDPTNLTIKKTVWFVPKEANTFGWNNLRVRHGSMYDRQFQKALLIIINERIDADAFANLMERSIAAASPEQLYLSELPLSAYSIV